MVILHMTMDNSMKVRKGLVWHLIASAFIALVVSSCSSSIAPSIDVERRGEFVDLLVDIQLLEAAYKQKVILKEETDSVMQANYKLIFLEHDMTQDDFNIEFEFWKNQPKQMATMYAEVVERLNKLDTELRAKAEESN